MSSKFGYVLSEVEELRNWEVLSLTQSTTHRIKAVGS